ncbi:MAG: type III-B CRISPR module RAMP protein Cmr6 [Pseudomonadota bacterium]|nr:type III-B CRISPR module RAMP protein Cmr6 [Pseudomonadota bacterium]
MPLSQRIAALPAYIPSADNTALVDAAPGHRFLMYLRYWQGLNGDAYAAYKKCRPQGRDERAAFTRESAETLKEVCPLGNAAKATLGGIRTRQQALIATYGADGLRIPATSTAPFATGLGNEHPIENGFAFLTPYGLPYLAGSGVKGVLRRAAEEMALFPEEYALTPLPEGEGLSLLDIWWLFGFEGAETKNGPVAAIFDPSTLAGRAFEQTLARLVLRDDLRDFIRVALADDKKTRAYFLDDTEDRRPAFLQRLLADKTFRQSIHTRGALDCWDVFPAPAGDRLVVEIMTPHHAGYYMNGQTPHDAESPVPVSFLAVPALSAFDFHVVCASSRLPEPLRSNWQPLLQRIFRHAFDWLGFGAKTAVGYGAMVTKEAPATVAERPAGELTATGSIRQTASTPTEVSETLWPTAKLTLNPGTGEIKAMFEGRTTAGLKGSEADALRIALGDRANKLKKDKELKNVAVKVSQQSNLIVLLGFAGND